MYTTYTLSHSLATCEDGVNPDSAPPGGSLKGHIMRAVRLIAASVVIAALSTFGATAAQAEVTTPASGQGWHWAAAGWHW